MKAEVLTLEPGHRLSDTEADFLLKSYHNDPKTDISPILEVSKLVFHKKLNEYKNFQWYSLNKDDINSEFNLWFFETINKFNPNLGSILPFLFTNLDFLISELFYRHTGNYTNLDKNMLTLKYAYSRLVARNPKVANLSSDNLKSALRDFLINEKIDFYLSSNSKDDSYQLAQKYLISSGLEAALNYLPEIVSNSELASIEALRTKSNFDIPNAETSEPTLDLLVKMSLGENLWATDAFLEYLGIEGESSLSLNKTALNRDFSKKDLSSAISDSFKRISNPMIHFAYLADPSIATSDSLLTFETSQFSDF